MKNSQAHTVRIIATDSVSIWEYKEQITVTFRESQENTVEVQGADSEEFLKSISYYIHRLTRTDDLSHTKKGLLNTILADLKVMAEIESSKVAA